jgi:uncharacterized protein involved in cysteine biosynthesis
MAVRIFFAVCLGLAALVCGLFGCAPVAAILAGIAVTTEVFDAPLARRGLLFPATLSRVFKTSGWHEVAVVATVCSLLPLVNVFALPVLVAAATSAVNEAERGRQPA